MIMRCFAVFSGRCYTGGVDRTGQAGGRAAGGARTEASFGERTMAHETTSDHHGIASEIRRMADGLSLLGTESIHLAKVELRQAAREAALDVALIAVFGALALLGYALGCFAVAVALAPAIGAAWAFAAVALFNIGLGGLGAALAVSRLGALPSQVLEESRETARETARELKQIPEIARREDRIEREAGEEAAVEAGRPAPRRRPAPPARAAPLPAGRLPARRPKASEAGGPTP